MEAELYLYESKKEDIYDTIIGRYLLTKLGNVLDYSNGRFAWHGVDTNIKPVRYWENHLVNPFEQNKQEEETHAIIKDTNYKQVDLGTIVGKRKSPKGN